MWERACSRRRRHIQHRCRLIHRLREQARSHKGSASFLLDLCKTIKGAAMPAIRIGINPISWSNDDLPSLGGETPLSTALSEGKEIGYEGFELNGKFPKDAKGVGDVLRPYDL